MVFSSQLREFPQMIIVLDKYTGYMLTSSPNYMMSSSVAMEMLFYPLVQRESNLILILIIKENIRNNRKSIEKLRGYTYKITNISAANCHREANMVPK